MGNIRKINGEYFIEFFARGLKYQQKAGTDKRLALKALAEIEEKIARGEAALIVRDVDINIFFADFLDYIKPVCSLKTFLRYKSLLKNVVSFLKKHEPKIEKLSQLTPRAIEHYKSFLLSKDARQKINLSILLLRDVFEYAIKLGYLNDNPVLHIKLLEDSRLRPPTFTVKEAAELLQNFDHPLSAILEVMLTTGLSLKEAVSLKWVDVDFENHRIKLSSRDIPLLPRAEEILNTLRGQDKNTIFIFGETGKRILKSKQFEEKLLRRIRNTFAESILRQNVPLVSLQRILGLKDVADLMDCICFISQGREVKDFYQV